MPTIGIEGGRINIVPVDFVADALDFLAHKKGFDGKCFHLTDPEPHRIGEVLNIFASAAHAPLMTMRVNAKMFGFIPAPILYGLGSLAPVKRAVRVLLQDLGIPKDVFQFVNWPTRYDNREAAKALKGSGIEVPDLQTYAWRLWDYWERHLDPDLFIDRSLSGRVRDKVVVVTGASSGIGKATALKLAEAGARVVLVARGEDKLVETRTEIDALGGKAFIYAADVSDMASCDALVARVLKEQGGCDFLVNNAGRSIRRGVANSFDRFHDFERTMQLNYFGALRLVMGFLPKMIERKRGHIINISSIGVLSNAPRFSAYVASKAALDAFSTCAASEFLDKNIDFTTINMPLVRTPMIAPTKMYESVPTLSPEEAADLVVEAIVHRPVRIATRLGVFGAIAHAVAPRITQVLLNTAFNMFPDSAAAQGRKDGEPQTLSPEQVAFAQITQGIHW
jgi:NAD(P)-dependent dehydrogenase (short-subunit alcohol dehydrogenase family)